MNADVLASEVVGQRAEAPSRAVLTGLSGEEAAEGGWKLASAFPQLTGLHASAAGRMGLVNAPVRRSARNRRCMRLRLEGLVSMTRSTNPSELGPPLGRAPPLEHRLLQQGGAHG